jgi:hypothetical protein
MTPRLLAVVGMDTSTPLGRVIVMIVVGVERVVCGGKSIRR